MAWALAGGNGASTGAVAGWIARFGMFDERVVLDQEVPAKGETGWEYQKVGDVAQEGTVTTSVWLSDSWLSAYGSIVTRSWKSCR
jgi:hypothetical protein